MSKKILFAAFLTLVLSLSFYEFASAEQCPRLTPEQLAVLRGYDLNRNGKIDLSERNHALSDWAGGKLTDELILLILKYWRHECSLITPLIKVISPNGGERWEVGRIYEIAWECVGVKEVTINLLKGSPTATPTMVIAPRVACREVYRPLDPYLPPVVPPFPPGGVFRWRIPPEITPGDDYYIQIEAVERREIKDTSDRPFSIVRAPVEDRVSGTLSVDKTRVKVGEPITLTIIAKDAQGVIEVLAWYHGKWHSHSCEGHTECTKTFTFTETTPRTKEYHGYVYGRRLDGTVEAAPTTPPSVRVEVIPVVTASITVISPNGGEIWEIGKTYEIKWTSTGTPPISHVRIDLYKAGSLFRTIDSSTVNDSSERWTIPRDIPAGTDYRIRISDVRNPAVFDESDANFEIKPAVIVEDPVSGTLSVDKTTVRVGEQITLTITAKDAQGVNGVYALYQGRWNWQSCGFATTCTRTFTFSEVATGTYTYSGYVYGRKIDGTPEFNPTTPPSVTVTVTPVPAPSITVISPNGGEVWEIGKTYEIKWTSAGTPPVSHVRIDLYKAGSLFRTIVSSTVNDGSDRWTIPSGIPAGTDYTIRISDLRNPAIFDESDANFEIRLTAVPSITSIHPTFGSSNSSITIFGRNLRDTIPSGIKIEFIRDVQNFSSLIKY